MEDRQRRVLESIEKLILHPNTSEHEKNAGINRWEHITEKTWTGRRSSTSTSSGAGNQRNSKGGFDAEDFWKGFQQQQKQQSKNNSATDDGSWSFDERSFYGYKQKQQSKSNWSYDFGGGCTESQYNYVKSICDFFRWKCPQRHEIEFDEAKEFLNKYSELFNMINYRQRNFSNLKKLFDALGIDWSQTKRTWKWKSYGER